MGGYLLIVDSSQEWGWIRGQEPDWDNFIKIKPRKKYTSIELFAGAGGMAIGMEKAGIKHVLLNEFEKKN